MLQHFDIAQAGEEADLAEWPDLGIGAEEQEQRESEKHQRPVSRGAQSRGVQQRKHPDGQHEQAGPMVVVFGPRDVGGVARRQVAGTRHEGHLRRRTCCAASASSFACKAGSASLSWSGEARPGQRGMFRSMISGQVTRSCVRSTAGGTEVSEAAAKKIATPMPISTSANRFNRVIDMPGGTQPFDQHVIRGAQPEQQQEHGDLGADHHAIGRAVQARPVADIAETHGDSAHHDAGHSGDRHAGEPLAHQSPRCALWTRARAIRKHGMPPIQMAAPNWCRKLTSNSGVRCPSRAAACVVSVAAASSMTQAPATAPWARAAPARTG